MWPILSYFVENLSEMDDMITEKVFIDLLLFIFGRSIDKACMEMHF